jgi:hypothetical protein
VADSTKGELIEDSGDFKYITACQTPQGKALLICISSGAGGNPLPQTSMSGSGQLVGAAILSDGYAAGVPNALAVNPTQVPTGVGPTANVRLSLFITDNTFVATTTTFEIYRGGVATGDTITVAAGVFGPPTLQTDFILAFGQTDRFDLRVSNPGGVAEVGAIISFGWSAVLF